MTFAASSVRIILLVVEGHNINNAFYRGPVKQLDSINILNILEGR